MSYGTAIPELPLTIGAVRQSASRSNLITILYHKRPQKYSCSQTNKGDK